MCMVMTTVINLPAASSPTAPWPRHSSASMATVMLSSSLSLCLVRMCTALPQAGVCSFIPFVAGAGAGLELTGVQAMAGISCHSHICV